MKFNKSATISLITVFVIVILTIIIVPICVVHACPSKSAPIEAKKLQSDPLFEPYDPNKNINNNFYGKNQKKLGKQVPSFGLILAVRLKKYRNKTFFVF